MKYAAIVAIILSATFTAATAEVQVTNVDTQAIPSNSLTKKPVRNTPNTGYGEWRDEATFRHVKACGHEFKVKERDTKGGDVIVEFISGTNCKTMFRYTWLKGEDAKWLIDQTTPGYTLMESVVYKKTK